MAPPAASGGGQSDSSMGMLWGIAAIFAAIGIIWYAFRNYLIIFYLTLKLYEIDLLNALTGDRYAIVYQQLVAALQNAGSLAFPDLIKLGNSASAFLKYPFALILAGLAVVLYFSNSARSFRRIYSMRVLARLEQSNWPQITPIVPLYLLNTELDKGPWAMAMQPIQFCKKYQLLEEVYPEQTAEMTHRERRKVQVVLRRGEANRTFILQLGPLWRGTTILPPYIRGLFAVFAARINADSALAAELLKQFNLSCTTNRLDVRQVDETIKKYEKTKLVQRIIANHAYTYTVMAALLVGAREDGVQASADFLWLKKVDRRLWYMLNAVGRQTAFVEIGGLFAHWKAEKEAGVKLFVPMVDEATKALEAALKDIVYHSDEEEAA